MKLLGNDWKEIRPRTRPPHYDGGLRVHDNPHGRSQELFWGYGVALVPGYEYMTVATEYLALTNC